MNVSIVIENNGFWKLSAHNITKENALMLCERRAQSAFVVTPKCAKMLDGKDINFMSFPFLGKDGNWVKPE